MKRKLIAVFLFLFSFSSLSLLFEEKNFIYLILAAVFAFGGVKLFKNPKGNKKSSTINTNSTVAKATTTEPSKYSTPSKSNKKYYTFKVAGVTKRNDEGDNIQYIISEYVKEQLEFIDAYDGLKNKKILEEYYDDKVYEISDLFLNKNEIRFVYEPDNPYDPNAIKIISEFMGHIGYVPKDETAIISEIIRNKNYSITAEIIGGKYKYVDHDKDKIKIEKDYYDVEIEISYEESINKNLTKNNEEIKTIDADFIAIDFETANNNNNSACSMGLVVVKDLEIIESKYFLIQPSVMSFDDVNIKIHGIMAKDVKDKPKFPEIWNEIKHYFLNNIIIAHNAQFDMSVLKSLQLEYNLNIPDFDYMDSMTISTKACGGEVKKTLSARAEALGVEFKNHHNALDDTIACANIVIQTVKRCKRKSFQSFIKVYSSLNKKKFSELKHQPYFKKGRTFHSVRISEIETCTTTDCNNPFYGKNIVFTGELSKYGRREAMQLVADLGGVIKSGVSSKTDYLIVGVQDESIVGDDGLSNKEEKAYELIENGQDIEILDEDDFYELLGEVVKV